MPNERIERMHAEGLLTDEQAAALRSSLSPWSRGEGRRSPRRVARIWPGSALLGAALLLVVALFVAGGTDAPGTMAVEDVSQTLNTTEGTGAMNKTLSNLLSAALLLLPVALIVVAFVWIYNSIVDKEEKVYTAWSQVESNLQRRADLVPNLVETVGRYLRHERETLQGVTEERGAALNPLSAAMNELIATQAAVATPGGDVPLEDEALLAELARAQQALGGSLRNLIAVAESYPNLRSGDQFLSLQAQLEGTENRINVARMGFNDAVGHFNSAIRRMPGSFVAGIGNFNRKAYFQTDDGVEAPVSVAFD
jgi:LemA protein